MPLREFKCPRGHLTEKLLMGDADAQMQTTPCEAPVEIGNFTMKCGETAERVEFSTTNAQFMEGCGGFYSPSRTGRGRTTSRGSDPFKAADTVIQDMRETNGGKLPLNNPLK